MKKFVIFIGNVLNYSMMLVLAITFYHAYLSHDYIIFITINTYNEATIEAVILACIILIGTVGLIEEIK